LKDEILKGLHPHRRSISSEPGKIGPAQIDLANQLFNAAERIIGEPVEFIALGEYSILRDGKGYQMRKTESINIGRNSPTDSL
jgi:hypothetical protein